MTCLDEANRATQARMAREDNEADPEWCEARDAYEDSYDPEWDKTEACLTRSVETLDGIRGRIASKETT